MEKPKGKTVSCSCEAFYCFFDTKYPELRRRSKEGSHYLHSGTFISNNRKGILKALEDKNPDICEMFKYQLNK